MNRPISKLLIRPWLLLAVAALLGAAFLGGGLVARATNDFTDVPTTAFYHDAVSFLKAKGITVGCGAGIYCPNDNVTRGEMAVFLQRMAGDTAAPSVNADKLDGIDSTNILPGGTLPSGATVRGTYGVELLAGALDDRGLSTFSFGYTLASEPTTHFIAVGGTPPAECPGTAGSPEAAPGHLCVYEQSAVNQSFICVVKTGGDYDCDLSNAYGAGVFLRSAAAGNARSVGSWAVTAP